VNVYLHLHYLVTGFQPGWGLPMNQLDWLYSALIAVFLVADHFVFTHIFRRRAAADPRKAFRWLWLMFLRNMWLMTVLGVFLWLYEGRPWGDVALSMPSGWRLWGGIGLVLMVAILYARNAYRVAHSARSREKVRGLLQRQEVLAAITPRTGPEFQLWVVASLTAGVTEEFLCRGYILWVFHHWISWWLAAAASSVIFGLGHSYQGPRGVLQTALGGAVFAAVVGISGSLLPAMVIHALVDIGAGYYAWLALRDEGATATAAVPVAP
jgi:hypothetical protein